MSSNASSASPFAPTASTVATVATVALPDSLRFYWGDRANRAAVDILCQNAVARTLGADLTIEELEDFETARLAAWRVRHDLWRLLRAIWSATWGASMHAHLPQARLLNLGEHDLGAHGTYGPTLERAWDERATYGLYELPGNLVAFTGVRLEHDDQRAAFEFSLMDRGTGDYPTGFAFPAGWQDRGQGWGVADGRVDVPVAFGGDTGRGDPAADLVLQPASDAVAALIAHVAAHGIQPIPNGL